MSSFIFKLLLQCVIVCVCVHACICTVCTSGCAHTSDTPILRPAILRHLSEHCPKLRLSNPRLRHDIPPTEVTPIIRKTFIRHYNTPTLQYSDTPFLQYKAVGNKNKKQGRERFPRRINKLTGGGRTVFRPAPKLTSCTHIRILVCLSACMTALYAK